MNRKSLKTHCRSEACMSLSLRATHSETLGIKTLLSCRRAKGAALEAHAGLRQRRPQKNGPSLPSCVSPRAPSMKVKRRSVRASVLRLPPPMEAEGCSRRGVGMNLCQRKRTQAQRQIWESLRGLKAARSERRLRPSTQSQGGEWGRLFQRRLHL